MTFEEDVNIAMELSGQINEELLVCHICFGRYSVRDRLPKLLHCSHTFCEECIAQYLRKRQKKSKHKFPCPLCRRETNVGKEGVSGLTNNFTVMSLLDILDRRAIEQFDRDSIRRRSSTNKTSSQRGGGSKQRPALHSIAWDSISESPESASTASESTIQNQAKCDNCSKIVANESKKNDAKLAKCKHLLCDVCLLKDKEACIKCKRGSKSASRMDPDNRPPPVNPAFGEVTSIRPIRPPVPTRSTPIKPLNQPSVKPSISTKPLISSPLASTSTSSSGTLGRSSSTHTMHLSQSSSSSGLSSTFGHSLHSQITLPASDSAQSLPELTNPAPTTTTLLSPPQPPPRRISNEGSALASPLRLHNKFGQFSTVRLQTNAFHQPTHLACSEYTSDWAVVDAVNMSVQIFSSKGQYKSLFKVLGVSSVCFVSPERLAVSTHRGIEIHHITGALVRELSIGRCDCIAAYKHGGFIVGQSNKVLMYGAGVSVGAGDIHKQCREIKQRKTGKFKRATNFQQIVSVAVTANKDIIILDAKLGDITILDDHGKVLLLINPSSESCNKLNQPHSVSTDPHGNIIVSDTGNRRVLRFSANGMFSRCLLNMDLGPTSSPLFGGVSVYGLAVSTQGLMGVVITGPDIAEVRVYQL